MIARRLAPRRLSRRAIRRLIWYILRQLEERGLTLDWRGNRFWARVRARDPHSPDAPQESGIHLVVVNGLFGTTAEAVAMQFEAVAAQGRSDRPVEHWVVSYGPEERVSDERIAADCSKFLAKLGFSEHHVWVAVVHEDGGALHVHVGLCITDPVTRRAHSCPRPVRTAERAVAEISLERGIPIVPGRHNLDLAARQRGVAAVPLPDRRRYARRPPGGRPWAEAVAPVIRKAAERSANWAQLEIALALEGIAILEHPTPRRSRLAFGAGHAVDAPQVSADQAGWPVSLAVRRFGYHRPDPTTAEAVAGLLLTRGLVAANGRRPDPPAGPRPRGRPPRPRHPGEFSAATGSDLRNSGAAHGLRPAQNRPKPARVAPPAGAKMTGSAEVAARTFALVALEAALAGNGASPDTLRWFARWRRAEQARLWRRLAQSQGSEPSSGAASGVGEPGTERFGHWAPDVSRTHAGRLVGTAEPPHPAPGVDTLAAQGGGLPVTPASVSGRDAKHRAATATVLQRLVERLHAAAEIGSAAIASVPSLGRVTALAELARGAGTDGECAANQWLEEEFSLAAERHPALRTAAATCRETLSACRDAARSLRVLASPSTQRLDVGEWTLLDEALAAACTATGWVPVAEPAHPLGEVSRLVSEIPRLELTTLSRKPQHGRLRKGIKAGGPSAGRSRPPPTRNGPDR